MEAILEPYDRMLRSLSNSAPVDRSYTAGRLQNGVIEVQTESPKVDLGPKAAYSVLSGLSFLISVSITPIFD